MKTQALKIALKINLMIQRLSYDHESLKIKVFPLSNWTELLYILKINDEKLEIEEKSVMLFQNSMFRNNLVIIKPLAIDQLLREINDLEKKLLQLPDTGRKK